MVGSAGQPYRCFHYLSAAVAQGGISARVVAVKLAIAIGEILRTRQPDPSQPLRHAANTLGVAEQFLAKFGQ